MSSDAETTTRPTEEAENTNGLTTAPEWPFANELETDREPSITNDESVSAEPATVTQAEPLPVSAQQRVASVDVLRGVALMGILAMNIVGFAWPGAVYMNPHALPEPNVGDTYFWTIQRLLFDTKMMTTFSMLFGAGLVLMSDRASARGASLTKVYYRRVSWLLVIGLIHAYLIWDGDILVDYALGGFLLYPFRKLSARWLMVLGTISILTIVPLFLGFMKVYDSMRQTSETASARLKAGEEIGLQDRFVRRMYRNIEKNRQKKAKPEDLKEELKVHRGNYWGIVKNRAPGLLIGHTIGFVMAAGFMVIGRMLLGMGLMKLGFYSASLSRQAYWRILMFCYGIGYPFVLFDVVMNIRSDFHHPDYSMSGGFLVNYLASVLVAIGHGAAVMLIYQSGALSWLTKGLAAAGRMALSNYLFDSIFCTTLFYGYGLGLTGTMHRAELAAIVLAIWTFQLLFSPLWLRFFRFGPAEWVWRSLTYWRLQPILR